MNNFKRYFVYDIAAATLVAGLDPILHRYFPKMLNTMKLLISLRFGLKNTIPILWPIFKTIPEFMFGNGFKAQRKIRFQTWLRTYSYEVNLNNFEHLDIKCSHKHLMFCKIWKLRDKISSVLVTFICNPNFLSHFEHPNYFLTIYTCGVSKLLCNSC